VRRSRAPSVAVVAACAAAAPVLALADGLWGSESLFSGPPLRANDVVTLVVERPNGRTLELASRVVKVLPNGNAVVEAKVRCGDRSLLVSGEAARSSVTPDRRLPAGRVASLAVVARGVSQEALAGLVEWVERTEGAEGAKGRSR